MFDQWDRVRRLLLVCVDARLEELEPALSLLRDALPGVYLTLWAAPDDAEQAVSAIRAGRYDAALILSAPGRSPYGAAYACYLAGVPIRLGQAVEFGGAVLSHRFIPPAPPLRPADHYLHLISQLLPPPHGHAVAPAARQATPEAA